MPRKRVDTVRLTGDEVKGVEDVNRRLELLWRTAMGCSTTGAQGAAWLECEYHETGSGRSGVLVSASGAVMCRVVITL